MSEETKNKLPDKSGTGLQQPNVKLPNKGLRGALAHWADWAAIHMSEGWFLIFLSTIVGILAGVGAWLMNWLIYHITYLVWSCHFIRDNRWTFFILPIIGFSLSAWFCRKVVKEKLEYGTQRISNALRANNYKLSWKLMWSPIAACSITLGLGGSAGSEGPIAFAGAGIGSNVGQYFELQPRYLRILIGVGAGAGIAAIFKAPLGGVFFTLEIIKMEISSIAGIALVVGCLFAWGTTYLLEGCTLDVDYSRVMDFSLNLLPGMICLGIVCGLYSLYYSYTLQQTEKLSRKTNKIWAKVLLTGSLVGTMIYFFPDLYGEGYTTIGKALAGQAYTIGEQSRIWANLDTKTLMLLLFALAAIKAIATASTNSGGGVGGDFTPTLFAGAMLGLLFALCCNSWLGCDMNLGDYALCGMAGVMAGGVQAPLMGMFIVSEMCGDFAMFFPLMITAMISYVTTLIISHKFRITFIPAFIHDK